ncbi:hypothetical protein DL96DRAFT_1704517 [Flagelloscypha sp. PMI_526]|nr:hypothetical protein DL96DRAFT_1704517 [Flagelloscypha sp. PMI_526]
MLAISTSFEDGSSAPSSPYNYPASPDHGRFKRGRQTVCVRSPSFFLTDPLIFIRVSNTIYRVHRDKLQHHSVRIAVYIRQTEDWLLPPGLSEAHPLELDDCVCSEFEAFLTFVYEREITPSETRATLEYYISLLQFSKSYACLYITDVALKSINHHSSQLTPVGRLVLGKQFDLEFIQRSAYATLCSQSSFISSNSKKEEWDSEVDNEADYLDRDTLVSIATAQVRVLVEWSGKEKDQKYWEFVSRVVDETFFRGPVEQEFRLWDFPEDDSSQEQVEDHGTPVSGLSSFQDTLSLTLEVGNELEGRDKEQGLQSPSVLDDVFELLGCNEAP